VIVIDQLARASLVEKVIAEDVATLLIVDDVVGKVRVIIGATVSIITFEDTSVLAGFPRESW
jgi:hypothetical protein